MHVLIRRDARDDGVAGGSELSRCVGGGSPQLGGEGAGFFRRAIPDAGEKARAMKVARHVGAHGSKTDESHAHADSPSLVRRIYAGRTIELWREPRGNELSCRRPCLRAFSSSQSISVGFGVGNEVPLALLALPCRCGGW